MVRNYIIHAPIEDTTINFGNILRVEEINDAVAVSYFRLRHDQLMHLIHVLWDRLQDKFDGEYERIRVENRYCVPFDSGIMLCLYRFSRPKRIHSEMERFFRIRKSKISAAVKTFTQVIGEFAY